MHIIQLRCVDAVVRRSCLIRWMRMLMSRSFFSTVRVFESTAWELCAFWLGLCTCRSTCSSNSWIGNCSISFVRHASKHCRCDYWPNLVSLSVVLPSEPTTEGWGRVAYLWPVSERYSKNLGINRVLRMLTSSSQTVIFDTCVSERYNCLTTVSSIWISRYCTLQSWYVDVTHTFWYSIGLSFKGFVIAKSLVLNQRPSQAGKYFLFTSTVAKKRLKVLY